jgi:hypothetical protein
MSSLRAQISPSANPNAFYTQLVTAPYVNNAIISTHIYGPSVTHATTNYSGAGLDWRLSYSFGMKTLSVRLFSAYSLLQNLPLNHATGTPSDPCASLFVSQHVPSKAA